MNQSHREAEVKYETDLANLREQVAALQHLPVTVFTAMQARSFVCRYCYT